MKLNKINKHAEIAGQIFMYALTLIVVALILLYGYSAIKDFMGKSDDVTLIQLRTRMNSYVDKMSTEYGSIERVNNLNIPAAFKQVCFVDTRTISSCSLGGGSSCYFSCASNVFIDDSVKSGTMNNMFLIESKSDNPKPYYIGNITLTDKSECLCVNVIQSKIKIEFKGTGSNTLINAY